GPNRIGQKTGAGTMDAAFTWDQIAYAADKTKVQIATLFTRSNSTPNGNNSYEQGGLALATLTVNAAPQLGAMIQLPNLNGDRPWMRPQLAFTNKYILMIAASEDNNSNNGNPKPVAFLADKTTGALVNIKNSNRTNPALKP